MGFDWPACSASMLPIAGIEFGNLVEMGGVCAGASVVGQKPDSANL